MEAISDDDIKQPTSCWMRMAFKKTQEEFSYPGGKLELITEKCYPTLFEALKSCFLTDEPLEKSLEMSWSSDVEALWISALKDKMSLMVTNETNGDIMGVRVIRITKKSNSDEIEAVQDENVRKLIEFFKYATDNFDFYAKYDISEMFEFFGLGVVPKYRRQGLGTALMETGVKFLVHLLKPCIIKGSASSNFSKKIFEKCGFETLADFPFDEYIVDGKVVFDKTGEHKSMKLYGLRII